MAAKQRKYPTIPVHPVVSAADADRLAALKDRDHGLDQPTRATVVALLSTSGPLESSMVVQAVAHQVHPNPNKQNDPSEIRRQLGIMRASGVIVWEDAEARTLAIAPALRESIINKIASTLG